MKFYTQNDINMKYNIYLHTTLHERVCIHLYMYTSFILTIRIKYIYPIHRDKHQVGWIYMHHTNSKMYLQEIRIIQ